MRILVIDNYDSFVYNLVHYLDQLGADCQVRRHDELTVAEAARLRPAGVLLSPGPGGPAQAGICPQLVHELAGDLPILGVCLGHQVIASVYGATVQQAPELMHGMTSLVSHDGSGVLAGLPDPFTATRYHSLAVVDSTLPPELAVTARTVATPPPARSGTAPPRPAPPPPDSAQPITDFLGRPAAQVHDHAGGGRAGGGGVGGVVMAIRHRGLPLEGVQFHPEAVLSEAGHLLLANWLASCGLPSALDRAPALAAEVERRRLAAFHP